jgi:DNA-binding PadR family transcriptional regulator
MLLKPREIRILEKLSLMGPMGVYVLGNELGSWNGLSGLLSNLEKKDLITAEAKGKRKTFSVTTKGRETYLESEKYRNMRREGGFLYKEDDLRGTIRELYWTNPKTKKLERLK